MALFTFCLCRAVPGRKDSAGTSSGAAPMAISASLMPGAVMERVTAQTAVTRLAVSSNLLYHFCVLSRGVGGCPAQREVGTCLC